MNQENLIELKNVGVKYTKKVDIFNSKQRNSFWALRDVSMDLKRGEVLGVIGRNGAGKSTMLSLLAGIISPDSGEMITTGARTTLLSLQAGFVKSISGRKNVILNGMLLGLSKEEVQSRMNEVIELSELDDFIDEPVNTYSSGMKARLGFATAIYTNPDIILIDEVLGVGDKAFKEKSTQIMKDKIQSKDTTVVIVSHNENTVKELCHRALWIEKGKSQYFGETNEVLEKYNQAVEAGKKH